jgi:RecB family exonuclease
LNRAGIRVRTTADFESEERALFESAVGRATQLTVLTYPECDARGERTLASLYLEGRLTITKDAARAAAPRARSVRTARPPVEIRAAGLMPKLVETSAKLPATSLERYLQCPFEFFGSRTLRLRGAPEWPEKRLGFPQQGNIVHDVLKQWWPQRPADIVPIFEREFEQYCEKHRVPRSYHTERIRNGILADLQMFAADDRWPPGMTSLVEKEFTLPLQTAAGETIEIPGRIDRLDTDDSGHDYVLDYKYSANARVRDKLKNEQLLQGQMYGMAAEHLTERPPAGVLYLGVKGKIDYVGWSVDRIAGSEEFPKGWFEKARESTLSVIGEIRAGTIAPDPSDLKHCKYCDFRDACRFDSARAGLLEDADAAGAAEDAE